jgi:hypothetical protein
MVIEVIEHYIIKVICLHIVSILYCVDVTEKIWTLVGVCKAMNLKI